MARRSGLGKGLGALLPTEVISDKSSILREVPVSSIRPNPMQPRNHFDEEAMGALAASIREIGVLQPILVRQLDAGQGYELIAGERRWRASRRAGLQTIPVIVQTVGDLGSLEHALVENLHREDLNPLEEAAAYQQLIDDFSYTHDQVATRIGKSRAAVTNTLRLLQAPVGVQRALADGALSAGHARALLATPDRARQEELAQKAIKEGLSVRAIEELVRKGSDALADIDLGAGAPGSDPSADGANLPAGTSGGPSSSTLPPSGSQVHGDLDLKASGQGVSDQSATWPETRPPLPPPGVLELEELLAEYLSTRVKVEMHAKRGRVVVDFATLEDLERIYKLMAMP